MYFYLPKNLEITDILIENPPEIENFNKWNLLYFVHLVSYLPSVSKKMRDKQSGFVNLSSTLLQQIVWNYSDYLRYLTSQDIFEANNHYLPGSFSKSYRLTSQYSNGIISVKVTDKKFAKHIDRVTGLSDEQLKKLNTEYSYLLRQFHGLKYDYNSAEIHIYKMEFMTLGLDGYYNTRYANERIREIRINNLLLKNKEYHCKVDTSSGRFHSVITRLRKEFRQFLSYNGEPLISLDIKSSQPYIAQRLFMPEFWIDPAGTGKSKPGPKKKSSTQGEERVRKLIGPTLDELRDSYSRWGIKLRDIEGRIDRGEMEGVRRIKDSSPMLVLRSKQDDIQSVMRFCNLINEGDVYVYLLDVLKQKLKTSATIKNHYKKAPFALTRSSMKKLFLRGMYSPSRSKNHTSKLVHQIFKEEFPGVEKIFNHIKNSRAVNYRVLALILQAIESEILLKNVCPQIVHKNRHIPFFTIHDSILTISKYKEDVRKIMEDEFEKAIGIKPTIKEEAQSKEVGLLMDIEEQFVSWEDIQEEEGL